MAPTRRCSDPIYGLLDFEDDESIDSACADQDLRTVPRQMKTSLRIQNPDVRSIDFAPALTDSFLCCDSSAEYDDEENFLDDAKCVPYRNKFYENLKVKKYYGVFGVISCDFPGGDFRNPRPVGNGTYDDLLATRRYECCKTGPPLDPYIHDKQFNVSVYPTYVLWWIAAVLSAVVVVALLIPLWIQTKNGSLPDQRWSSQSRRKPPKYNSYNVYLMYLSFADLVYSLIQIYFYSTYINQSNSPFYNSMADKTDMSVPVYSLMATSGPINLSYVFINMFLNVMISYDLLILLRKSQQTTRIKQPKLKTIHLRCGIIYGMAIVYATILYILRGTCLEAINNYDIERVTTLKNVLVPLWNTILIIPVVPIVVIGFWVWWGNYIPRGIGSTSETSARDRGLRRLVFFFARVVLVFVAVWVPVQALISFGFMLLKPHYFLIVWWLMAVQIILSFGVFLTKYDVRKYIFDLLTLSYICGNKKPTPVFERSTTPLGTSALGIEGSYIGHPSGLNDSATPKPHLSSRAHDNGGDSRSYGSSDDNEDDSDALFYSVLGFVPTNAKEVDDKPRADSESGIALTSNGTSKQDLSDGTDVKNNDTTDAIAADRAPGVAELLDIIAS